MSIVEQKSAIIERCMDIMQQIVKLKDFLLNGTYYDPVNDIDVQLTTVQKTTIISKIKTKRDNLVTLLQTI